MITDFGRQFLLGGTPLRFGDEVIGQALDAPLPASNGWNLSRIADLSLAQAAYQLANDKRLWLPTMNASEAAGIPITTVASIGKIGPYHADINGDTSTGSIRGPFTVSPVKANSAPTLPDEQPTTFATSARLGSTWSTGGSTGPCWTPTAGRLT